MGDLSRPGDGAGSPGVLRSCPWGLGVWSAIARGSFEAVSYTECRALSPLVACTWEQVTLTGQDHLVVPDACVDLIWSGERLSIAGPDTGPRMVMLEPGTRLVGARLRMGAAGSALGLPASEIRDLSPDAAEVLGKSIAAALLDRLHAGADPHLLLLRALELQGLGEPDPLVSAAIAALDRSHARVDSVADELGVSARHLQRRVGDAVGYGPKILARVLRFRRLQALPRGPLVDLALEAGYADQAHMTAEVTRLAGVSPVRFLKDRTPTAA
jgi:AraC-like DNA-binding protein